MLSDTVLLRILVLIFNFFQCCGDISMYIDLELHENLEAQKDFGSLKSDIFTDI